MTGRALPRAGIRTLLAALAAVGAAPAAHATSPYYASTTVRCALSEGLVSGWKLEGLPVKVSAMPSPTAEASSAVVVDGVVEMTLLGRETSLVLDIGGKVEVHAIYDGRTTCTVEPDRAWVTVHVRTASGEVPQRAELIGCKRSRARPGGPWTPANTVFAFQAGEPCPLSARIEAGWGSRSSEPLTLERAPLSRQEITLVVPDRLPALGLSVHTRPDQSVRYIPIEGGVPPVIHFLRPATDGPAWRAGIRQNYRLLAVDGRPVGELSPAALAALDVGPPDSQVVFQMEHEGQVGEIVVRRELPPR